MLSRPWNQVKRNLGSIMRFEVALEHYLEKSSYITEILGGSNISLKLLLGF